MSQNTHVNETGFLKHLNQSLGKLRVERALKRRFMAVAARQDKLQRLETASEMFRRSEWQLLRDERSVKTMLLARLNQASTPRYNERAVAIGRRHTVGPPSSHCGKLAGGLGTCI
jgi:hypothetical protein